MPAADSGMRRGLALLIAVSIVCVAAPSVVTSASAQNVPIPKPAQNVAAARQLWSAAEQLTGVQWPF